MKNPHDIITIVTAQDEKISRMFLHDGIGHLEGVQRKYPGSFSEEMDSPERARSLTAIQFDPIDGTGDLKLSADLGNPYGATNLVSRLDRGSIQKPFVPTSGMIYDFLDEVILLSDGTSTELCRVDKRRIVPISFQVRRQDYMEGEPIRVGRRDAYPHEGFDAFVRYLADQKKADIHLVPVGGAGRMAMQVFRANIHPLGDVPADWSDTAIDVMINYQPDHKTWDLDPTLVMYGNLGVTMPTDIYGRQLTANAAAPELKYGAWHMNGYTFSSRGQALHDKMTSYVKDFERDTGHRVLDKKLS